MDQKTLERYIDRVIKLQEQRSGRLHTDELEAIALDLGLSIDALKNEVDAHLQRGRGYMAQGLWDDAIKELREAEALAPGDVDVVMALADAHANRWEKTDFVDDKEQARSLAKAALELDPNHAAAFELMGRLEHGSAPGPNQPHPPRPSVGRSAGSGKIILGVIFGVVLLLTLMGGMVGYLVLSTRDATPQLGGPEYSSPINVDHSTPEFYEPTDSPGDVVTPEEATGGEPGSRDLKLQVTGPHADKLEFDVRMSRLNVYKDSAFYSLKAVMTNVSDQELSKVETVIELLDADGEVLHRDDPSLLWDHQPTIRPGDLSPINLTQRASAAVQGIRLNIRLINGTPGASKYAPAPPVDVKMGAKFPGHLNLEVRERSASFRPGSDGRNGYFKATFELENKGEAAIKSLKLQLDLFGSDGKLLETKTGIVAYSMTPSIGAGETWLENFIAEVETSYDRYELTVVELE